MTELLSYLIGVTSCLAVFYIIEQKKRRQEEKRKEMIIKFIKSIDEIDNVNYVSTSTWNVTDRFPARPKLTKNEVWEMCVDMYESKVIDSVKFREVSRLLDHNLVREAYDILNSTPE